MTMLAQFFQDAVVRDGAANNRGWVRHGPRILRQRQNACNRARHASDDGKSFARQVTGRGVPRPCQREAVAVGHGGREDGFP
jgi:hypothetical protein